MLCAWFLSDPNSDPYNNVRQIISGAKEWISSDDVTTKYPGLQPSKL
jgi:hypothetical protein